MFNKKIIMLGMIILIVAVFILSYVGWEWCNPKYPSEKMAYLSMLGGWVSGLATVAAVVVSLYATFQSRLLTTENLILGFQIKYSPYPWGDISHFSLEVKNKGHVRARAESVYLNVSGSDVNVSINFLRRKDVSLPCELKQIGDCWLFEFDYVGDAIGAVFGRLVDGGRPTFKHGHFVVETAMRQHQLRMSKEFLQLLEERYSEWQTTRDQSHNG
jgi:hypothetical protein